MPESDGTASPDSIMAGQHNRPNPDHEDAPPQIQQNRRGQGNSARHEDNQDTPMSNDDIAPPQRNDNMLGPQGSDPMSEEPQMDLTNQDEMVNPGPPRRQQDPDMSEDPQESQGQATIADPNDHPNSDGDRAADQNIETLDDSDMEALEELEDLD